MSLLKERNAKLRNANTQELSVILKNKYELEAHGLKEESVVFKPKLGINLKDLLLDAFMVKGVTKKKVFISWYAGLYEVPNFNSKNQRTVYNNFYKTVKEA